MPADSSASGRARLVLALLAAGGLALFLASRVTDTPPATPKNLILISLDTLRADHIGAWGYGRPTTPRLDEFFSEATVFRRAVAQANATIASHASLFTSQYPTSVVFGTKLLEGTHTLAQQLHSAGFQTGAEVDGGNLSREFGFDRGFESYQDSRGSAQDLVDRAENWVEAHADAPFFLFLHTYEPHTPYNDRREHVELFGDAARFTEEELGASFFADLEEKGVRVSDGDLQEFIARYDAGIRRTDDAIGGFLDFLDQRGLLETTLIVLTSDHGEEFLEHGRFGHFQIFLDPNLRVPLAFRLPGSPGRVFEETVELTDIIPTVRQLFGLPLLEGFVGRDLSPQILFGARPDPSRVAYSQAGFGRGFHTVIDGRHQLLVKRDTGRAELFDLESDPQARVNIASEFPGKVAELRAVLDSRLSASQAAGHARRQRVRQKPLELDERRQQELKALGYIQ
jgi:arylsulfatase A-like enzyme